MTNPGYLHHEDQCTFLKYASFILGIQYTPHHYTPVLKILDIKYLADCWRMLGKIPKRSVI